MRVRERVHYCWNNAEQSAIPSARLTTVALLGVVTAGQATQCHVVASQAHDGPMQVHTAVLCLHYNLKGAGHNAIVKRNTWLERERHSVKQPLSPSRCAAIDWLMRMVMILEMWMVWWGKGKG